MACNFMDDKTLGGFSKMENSFSLKNRFRRKNRSQG